MIAQLVPLYFTPLRATIITATAFMFSRNAAGWENLSRVSHHLSGKTVKVGELSQKIIHNILSGKGDRTGVCYHAWPVT